MSTPIAYSEILNYYIKYKIFDCADKATERTEKALIPAFIALSASSITYLVLRSLATAEMTIHGLILICFPHQRILGKAILKRVPVQILHIVVGLPITIVLKTFFIFYEPKRYILDNVEQIKVDLKHMASNSIDSECYKRDSEEAGREVKKRLWHWKQVTQGAHA